MLGDKAEGAGVTPRPELPVLAPLLEEPFSRIAL
jgi:hypothetical protein